MVQGRFCTKYEKVMNRITKKPGGPLIVPDNPIIPYIMGDGVGKEVTPAMIEIVDVAVRTAYGTRRQIHWKEALAGENAFNQTGEWLPDLTLKKFNEYLVGIKGPLTTPVGEGIRSLNVALRQLLDLYVCLRPIRHYQGIYTPIIAPEKVNMTVFRENTEDIYAGIEWEAGTPQAEKFLHFLRHEMGVRQIRFPETSAFGIKPISKEGSERLMVAACKYALDHHLPSVTIVHKGNIMKYTEGGFKRWCYEVAEREFADEVASGKLIIKDCIADAFLQNTLLTPEEYSVIATTNLNGDYISDQLAAMVGGIGIAPGANINYETGHAIFEATHGTAPSIAGRNIANPCSILLSAVMMLQYIGWSEAGTLITRALEHSFEDARATFDLARFMPGGVSLSTTEFTREIIQRIDSTNKRDDEL